MNCGVGEGKWVSESVYRGGDKVEAKEVDYANDTAREDKEWEADHESGKGREADCAEEDRGGVMNSSIHDIS